mmetsp:Transcript_131522/g.380425  ORF Transcript_131522/g.380425 Transcript_131522/m.380425 type:complete len:401 (+) Transcript_131522:3305-4507(+)
MMWFWADFRLSSRDIVPPTMEVCTHSAMFTALRSGVLMVQSSPITSNAFSLSKWSKHSWMYVGFLIDTASTNSRSCRLTKLPPCFVERPRQWHINSTAASSLSSFTTTSRAAVMAPGESTIFSVLSAATARSWSRNSAVEVVLLFRFGFFSRATVTNKIGWAPGGGEPDASSTCRANASRSNAWCSAQKVVLLPPRPSKRSVPRRIRSTTSTPWRLDTSFTSDAHTCAVASWSSSSGSGVSTNPGARSEGTSKPSKPKNAMALCMFRLLPTIERSTSTMSSSVGRFAVGASAPGARKSASKQFCMSSATARHFSVSLDCMTPKSGSRPTFRASITMCSHNSTFPLPLFPMRLKLPPLRRRPPSPSIISLTCLSCVHRVICKRGELPPKIFDLARHGIFTL